MKLIKSITNPLALFWITVILLIILTIWLLFILRYNYKMKYKLTETQWLIHNELLTFLIVCILTFTGYNYWSMSQQGLQSVFVNPYKAVKAAQLAPKINQISDTIEINSLTEKEKQNTIVIVYKFGCIDCQQLWLYAQQHPELLPSKNVLWIPTHTKNKEKSDLVASSTRYPSIIYWKNIDNNLIEERIEEPTDNQLEALSKLAKEYTK